MANQVHQQRVLFWYEWNIRAKILSIIFVIMAAVVGTMSVTQIILQTSSTESNTAAQNITLGDAVLKHSTDILDEKINTLSVLALTPQINALVTQANLDHAALTDADIQKLDQAWKDKAESINPTIQDILANPTSKFLKDFMKQFPEQVEVFLTDQKGLNVAMTDRTSDYLQADEGWWATTYQTRAPYLSGVAYDESTKSYAMDIGVPIFGADGKTVIGVLRGTLDISSLVQDMTSSFIDSTANTRFSKNMPISHPLGRCF